MEQWAFCHKCHLLVRNRPPLITVVFLLSPFSSFDTELLQQRQAEKKIKIIRTKTNLKFFTCKKMATYSYQSLEGKELNVK